MLVQSLSRLYASITLLIALTSSELLKMLGGYGYGHKLLLKAHNDWLVERRINKNR
jgi:hypothetical protein